MYNGIGLQTPRGSGTNGYVQRNLSLVKQVKDKVNYKTEEDIKKLDALANKQPNEDILAHERKRKVELKCMEMQELMEEQGYCQEEIDKKVAAFRLMLSEKIDTGEQDVARDDSGRPIVKESHQMAAANQKKNEKLKEALGISEHFVEGSSLDPQRKQKEALVMAKAQKKYISLFHDCSSSSSSEREKKTKSTEKEEKDDEVLLIKKRTSKKHHQERSISATSKNKRKTSDKRKKSNKDYKKKHHNRSSPSESSSSSTSGSSSDSSYSSSSQFSSESSDPSDSSSSHSSSDKRYKQKHKKRVKKGHEKKKYEEKTKKKSIKEHQSHRETQENSKKHLSWHSLSCSVSPSPHSPKVLTHLNVDEHSHSTRKHDSGARKSDKKSSSKRERSSSTEISAYQQKIDKKRKASLSNSDEETKKNKKRRRGKSSSSSSTGSSSGEEELTKKLYKKHHTRMNESKWNIDEKIPDPREMGKIDRKYPKEKSQTPEREEGRDSRSLSYSPIPNSRSLYARSRTEADSTSKLNGKRSKLASKYHDETSRSSLPERGEKRTDKKKEYSTKSPQSDYKFDYRREEAQYISAKKDKNPSPRTDRKEIYLCSRDEDRYSKSQSIIKSPPCRKSNGHDSSSSLSSSHSSLPQKAKTFSKSDSRETVSPTPDYQIAKKRRHSRSSSRSSLRSRSRSESHHSSVHTSSRTQSSRRNHSNSSKSSVYQSSSRSVSRSRSRSRSESCQTRSWSRSSRRSSRSPSIPKRRGSPSFLEKRRITRSRSRSTSKGRHHHYSYSRSDRMRKARDSPRRSFSRHHSHDRHY
ncbi:uncharacterized protein LOC143244784 isoform X2 [Tachypleus tridentatus]|uniref:uncharacterized protein LOC143244784 isoform X2 n=1 Tax=Tachypleus tridentatus TaxID=6853 RepID=UPI003FD446A2